MNLDDTSIIKRHGRFAVQAQRHEILWPDGTSVALHPVQENGHDSLFHRAVTSPAGLTIVFDLRQICPPLARELPATPAQDVVGVVFYSLRHHFVTAAAFWCLASVCLEACWVPETEGQAA